MHHAEGLNFSEPHCSSKLTRSDPADPVVISDKSLAVSLTGTQLP